jgi:hypothetical protein
MWALAAHMINSSSSTPGTGTVEAGDGRPYITEVCDRQDFAFLEVYVP